MKFVKISALFLLCVTSLYADFFTDKFFSTIPQEKAPIKPTLSRKEIYKGILPKVDNNNPKFLFIRSREPESMSLESQFLKMLHSNTHASSFIETGTCYGFTTALADSIFNSQKNKSAHVHSIELSETLFSKAQEKFKNNKNVCLHQGDTVQILPSILKTIESKPIIFLDAHFSMGDTAQGQKNTPIIDELDIIKQSKWNDAILIIDDIRMFYQPINDPRGTFIEGYPTLNMIVEKILEINSSYQCAVIYDTLIAFTKKENITVSPLVQAITISCLYDGKNYDIEEVLRAELCIALAKNNERENIADLGNRWIEQWSEKHGLSRHIPLWVGLVCLANEQFSQALSLFKEAKKRGLIDWRIDWYIALAEAECFFGFK